MKYLNSRGVAHILVILLVILLLGSVSYIAYTAYKANQDNKQQEQSQANTDTQTSEEPEQDPTEGWKTFLSEEGEYSFRHPALWVIADNLESCNPGLVLLGANKNSVGKCATESGGQMSVSSTAGNYLSEYELNNEIYPNVSTEVVTVAGVEGKRQTGTYQADNELIGVGPEDGDKTVLYTFYTNSRTYSAQLWLKDAYPDVTEEFDLLVTKTLKFSSS